MAYVVVLTPSARRAVKALPDVPKRRVLRALAALERDPRPSGAVALQGQEGLLRPRVGDYRIVYRVRDDALDVLIVRVGHRRDVYRGL